MVATRRWSFYSSNIIPKSSRLVVRRDGGGGGGDTLSFYLTLVSPLLPASVGIVLF